MELDQELAADAVASRQALGRVLRVLLVRNHGNLAAAEPLPGHIQTLSVYCESSLRRMEFEAVCSALAACQTTTKLLLRLNMDPGSGIDTKHWWKWLAYALFSKRARKCSSIETLAITGLHRMSVDDMKDFAAVLRADQPERVLDRSRIGDTTASNGTLKSGAKLRLSSRTGPHAKLVTTVVPIPFVRVFRKSHTTKWANALVPGYGWCQIQLIDLIPAAMNSTAASPRSLASLTIEFYPYGRSVSNGLPQFLAMVGTSLKSLTLQGPIGTISLEDIMTRCPNLKDLSICNKKIDLQMDVQALRTNRESVREMKLNWEDVAALASDLSDPQNPVSTHVRRLRARLGDHAEAGALVHMLDVNRHLQYLDVIAPTTEYDKYAADLRKHHLKPISLHPELSVKGKTAFLSVLSTRKKSAKKKQRVTRCGISQCDAAIYNLEKPVLANIFEFVAQPAQRQVFFTARQDASLMMPWLLEGGVQFVG